MQRYKGAKMRNSLALEEDLAHSVQVITEMETMTADDIVKESEKDLQAWQLATEQVDGLMESRRQESYKTTDLQKIKAWLEEDLNLLRGYFETFYQENASVQTCNAQHFYTLKVQSSEICYDIVQAMQYLQRLEQTIKRNNARQIRAQLYMKFDVRIIKNVMFKSGLFAEFLSGSNGRFVSKESLRNVSQGLNGKIIEQLRYYLEELSMQLTTTKDYVKFIRESTMLAIDRNNQQMTKYLYEHFNSTRKEGEFQRQAQTEFLNFYRLKTEEHYKFLDECQKSVNKSLNTVKYFTYYVDTNLQREREANNAKTQQLQAGFDVARAELLEHEKHLRELREFCSTVDKFKQAYETLNGQMQMQVKQNYDDYTNFVAVSNVPELHTRLDTTRQQTEKLYLQSEMFGRAKDVISQRIEQYSDLVKHFYIENQQQQFDFHQAVNKQSLHYQEVLLYLQQIKDSFDPENFNQLVKTQVEKELLEYMQKFETQASDLQYMRERTSNADKKLYNLVLLYNQLEAQFRKEFDEERAMAEEDASSEQNTTESAYKMTGWRYRAKEIKNMKHHQRLYSDMLQDHGKKIEELVSYSAGMLAQFYMISQAMSYQAKRAKYELCAEIRSFSVVKDDMTQKYMAVMKFNAVQGMFEQRVAEMQLAFDRISGEVGVLKQQVDELDGSIASKQGDLAQFIGRQVEEATAQLSELHAVVCRQTQELERLSADTLSLYLQMYRTSATAEGVETTTNKALARIEAMEQEYRYFKDDESRQNTSNEKTRKAVSTLLATARRHEQQVLQAEEQLKRFSARLLYFQYTQADFDKIPQIQQQIVFMYGQITRIDDTLTQNDRRLDYLRYYTTISAVYAVDVDVLQSLRSDLQQLRQKYEK